VQAVVFAYEHGVVVPGADPAWPAARGRPHRHGSPPHGGGGGGPSLL